MKDNIIIKLCNKIIDKLTSGQLVFMIIAILSIALAGYLYNEERERYYQWQDVERHYVNKEAEFNHNTHHEEHNH